MDEHDQALAWAQQNPDDPRSQDIQAKAWASKNPNDPRSAQILQHSKTKSYLGLDSPDPEWAAAHPMGPNWKETQGSGLEKLNNYIAETYASPYANQMALSVGPNAGMSQIAPKAISTAISKIAQMVRPLARRSATLSKVKDIGQLEPFVKQQVEEAQQAFGKNMPNSPQSIQEAVDLHKSTFGSGRNPIGTLTTKSLPIRSRLAQYDQQAGTELSQLGKDINLAQERLAPPTLSGLLSPKKALSTLSGYPARAVDASAEVVQPTIEGLSRFLQSPGAQQSEQILMSPGYRKTMSLPFKKVEDRE